MDDRDQTRAFADDINRMVDRYRLEFDLSLAAAAGVLAIIQHEIIARAIADEADNEEEE